jgi:TolA-binding protein
MSDPTRLLSGETSDFEKELLRSWNAEQPSDAARDRVLAIVGAGAVGGAVAAVAKVGGSIAPKAGVAGGAALAKWLAIGALGIVTASATVAYVRHVRRASHSMTTGAAHDVDSERSPAVSVPVNASAPAEATPRANEPAATTATPPESSARSTAPPRRGAGTEKSTHPGDPALGEQVSALDRARRALSDGDPAAALRELDEDEARFPRGALAEEAEVLRVESLLAAGDRATASRAGARFLAAHPASPHAARVHALLGQAPGP